MFKQRVGNQKTQMTKPTVSQKPQGKQLPDNYNRGNDHSYPVNAGNRNSGWNAFKKWGSCKGPGGKANY